MAKVDTDSHGSNLECSERSLDTILKEDHPMDLKKLRSRFRKPTVGKSHLNFWIWRAKDMVLFVNCVVWKKTLQHDFLICTIYRDCNLIRIGLAQVNVQTITYKVASSTSSRAGFELTTVVVIGTDICNSKSGADPGGAHPAHAPPPKIGKNMSFWRKIVIFTRNTPKKMLSAPP